MSISRYYTVGAVVPDIRSFKELGDRLDALDPEPDSVVVLVRRRDRPLAQAILPEARVSSVESGLSRRQWLEFISTFLSASPYSSPPCPKETSKRPRARSSRAAPSCRPSPSTAAPCCKSFPE